MKKKDGPGDFPARLVFLAGVEGFEPSLTAPKTAVLPLDDTPIALARMLAFGIVRECEPLCKIFAQVNNCVDLYKEA